ncbi:MAG: hypothetical protein JW852_02745, partial [Spirochaetales bacterium]|nr:hypothetical protein [Spirochaetales bacterium]
MAFHRKKVLTRVTSFVSFAAAALVGLFLSGCFLLSLFEEELEAPSISKVSQLNDISKIQIVWNWVDGAENFELWGRD